MALFKKPEDIKVGVVGYGGAFNMGRAHLTEMQRAGMTPVAVAELDKARRQVAMQEFPDIKTYATVGQMLKDSDVHLVAIITPHNTHAKLALQCLKAGRSVVCEKPLAITTAECDAMIAAAEANNLVLSTYHNRHWDGCILEAMTRIKGEGIIGEIIRIEAHMGSYGQPRDWWRTSKTISGGILYDWGVHLLEYSLQLLAPAEIMEVSGFAKSGRWAEKTAWLADTNEDEGHAVVRFNTGAWLSLNISNVDANAKADRGWLEITGTQGSYIMDGGTYTIIRPEANPSVVKGTNPPSEGWRFYQNIADHLVQETPLVITGAWARRPIHILDLACKSAEKNMALKAKYR